jgi:hypothetical protein
MKQSTLFDDARQAHHDDATPQSPDNITRIRQAGWQYQSGVMLADWMLALHMTSDATRIEFIQGRIDKLKESMK